MCATVDSQSSRALTRIDSTWKTEATLAGHSVSFSSLEYLRYVTLVYVCFILPLSVSVSPSRLDKVEVLKYVIAR